MPSTKKRESRIGRTPRPVALSRKGVTWGHFTRVTSQRVRLDSNVSRTYYALCHLFADEFDAQRVTLNANGVNVSTESYGHSLFLKHASSALRMLAERLLKSFRLDDVIRAERYSAEEWTIAVRRLSGRGELVAVSDPAPTAPAESP